MKRDPFASAGKALDKLLRELGRVTDTPGTLTRTFLSPAMGRANKLVATWMRENGLSVREDALGNLIGRMEARRPGAKTLIIGSHLDTVRNAGRFDGALGVLLPLLALGHLRREQIHLPFAVEVVGFSEEEGVRFSSAYLGSKGYAGLLRPADLRLADEKGITVLDCLERRAASTKRGPGKAGSKSGAWKIPARAHSPRDLLGYLEVHIEQGPVLEDRGLAAGVVSAIAGQTRAKIEFSGRAGHAGTTPMGLRQDALAGAAEFILAAESLAKRRAPLVATVGRIAASPGAANVIPGEVECSLDLRHPRDGDRLTALRILRAEAARIAQRRGLKVSIHIVQDNPSVFCCPRFTALLEESVSSRQGRSFSLPSGAGHDAVVLSSLTAVSMLFVRCRGGLSHHPDEHVTVADLASATEITVDFLIRLARSLHE